LDQPLKTNRLAIKMAVQGGGNPAVSLLISIWWRKQLRIAPKNPKTPFEKELWNFYNMDLSIHYSK
jgi:hypothetical protein